MVSPTNEAATQEDARGARHQSASSSSGCSSSSSDNNTTESPQFGGDDNSHQAGGLWWCLTRKKPLDGRTETSLNRCLNLLDLTTLGVGSTLGLGLYVLTGTVASKKAGPAVVLSFALAAIASAFSALCYAEFAGRVPRAGSAYAYSYISVGEFVAFVIGWNLVLEYVIGSASVARGFSSYLRTLATEIWPGQQATVAAFTCEANASIGGNSAPPSNLSLIQSGNMSAATNQTAMLDSLAALLVSEEATSVESYLEQYFDWPSLAFILVITVFILLGVKGSTHVTLGFTALNLLVVGLVVVSSLGHLDLHNWSLGKNEVPDGAGEGGFLPYGWTGVLAGSSTCFFGFIGFDTIASSAEEARSPKRNVPLSILLSLFISSVAYMLVALVQTLLWPYHKQDTDTILPDIFNCLGMPLIHWVVLLGALAGLASSLLGGMYPLPRILYSMADDKLIYSQLAHVNRRLKLPVRATIIGSISVGVLSCLMGLEDLANMVSIGTLAAYTLVSLSVLILRYESRADDSPSTDDAPTEEKTNDWRLVAMAPLHDKNKAGLKLETLKLEKNGVANENSKVNSTWLNSPQMDESSGTNNPRLQQQQQQHEQRRLLNLLITWRADKSQAPNDESSRLSKVLITVIVVMCLALNLVEVGLTSLMAEDTVGQLQQQQQFIDPKLMLICIGSIAALVLAATMLMLSRLPVSRDMPSDMFQVPLVPLVPTLSILINICLMFHQSRKTWEKFVYWMAVGFFIYFTYGIRKSRGYLTRQQR